VTAADPRSSAFKNRKRIGKEKAKKRQPGIILVIGSVDKFERKKNKDGRRVPFFLSFLYLYKREPLSV
jgi:hypothetical protein